MVWKREETRPRIRWKTDTGDGTSWEKKKRKTKTEIDALYQKKHEGYRTTKDEVYDITGWSRIGSAAAIPQFGASG